MKKVVTAALLALVLGLSAAADTLTLKNGSTVEGTYLGGDSREVRLLGDNGRVNTYLVSDVASLRFGEASAIAEQPAQTTSEPIFAPISAPRPEASVASGDVDIPEGSVVTIRTIDAIDSDVTDVGQRFAASLEDPLIIDGREIAPRGADAIISVARVDQAGRIRGREEVAIELVALMIDGREVALASNFAELESKSKTAQTAKTAGAGAAIGAIIGAIAGGGKGAAIGAGVGGGAGTVYSATRGTSVKVPSETLLTFVIQQGVSL